MIFNSPLSFLLLLFLSFSPLIFSHHFHSHDKVSIIANTIGPFNNPTETYPYYSLPFCSTSGKHKKRKQNLGETLSGDRKVNTPYEITFLDPVPWRSLCEVYLDSNDLKLFKDAIEDDYFFEFLIDDLPMWGYIGEVIHEEFLFGKNYQDAKVFLYPHLHFTVGYNNDQIVFANVTTDSRKRIDITDTSVGQEVIFSYSIDWIHAPEISYSKRFEKYSDSVFLPSTFEIHWLSIINSFVLIILLTIFLFIILMRILKKDFSKYMELDDDELVEEETGWKMIHGDVFRLPSNLNLFVALIGAGAQIFFTFFILLLSVLIGAFKVTRRGALLTAGIMIFAVCGFFGGAFSGRLFKQLQGKNWVWNTILTSSLFTVPLSLTFMFVNTVAWANNSTAALPVITITLIVSILIFVHLPLTIIGAIVGRNITDDYRPPCRTNKAPREIPPVTVWYKEPIVQIFMAGFLPFSAIYIELHYIFASIWGHKIYSLFGILFIAYLLLTIVTSFITIALIYFQLIRENYKWWWSSLVYGGSTGFFVFLYSLYFYHSRSNMDGFLQLSYYFGYMLVSSYAFFLMLGFIGFMSSFNFVHYIYSALKTD